MFIKEFGRHIAACAALIVGSIGTAQAVPYEWQDWAGDFGYYIVKDQTYAYRHDITNLGYVSGVDSVQLAEISIWLLDDALGGDLPSWLLGDGQETVAFRFDGGSWTAEREVGNNLPNILERFDFVVTSLLTDGLLDVSIRAIKGDLRFGASRLNARGERLSSPPTTVPEPATLSLLGFGLLGIGFAARRRRS